nr:hypothetical protein [uncultured Tyzzerella sp.]
MDIVRAKELILILAGGINPITGEILSEYDSCNQVEIVRALYTLLGECENNKKINIKKYENAGKLWSKEDENLLCHMYDCGKSKKEICRHFKRSSLAIEERLIKLGKIKNRYEII